MAKQQFSLSPVCILTPQEPVMGLLEKLDLSGSRHDCEFPKNTSQNLVGMDKKVTFVFLVGIPQGYEDQDTDSTTILYGPVGVGGFNDDHLNKIFIVNGDEFYLCNPKGISVEITFSWKEWSYPSSHSVFYSDIVVDLKLVGNRLGYYRDARDITKESIMNSYIFFTHERNL